MVRTTQEAADAWEQGWINAKDRAIASYKAQADTIADKIIAKKAQMIANYTTSLNSDALENGLAKYQVPGVLGQAYEDSLNQITAFGASKVAKMVDDITEKRTLAGRLDGVIVLLKANTTVGLAVEPPGLTDTALKPLVMSAILANQDSLSDQSTPAQIFTAISTTLTTTYGFPSA